MGNGSLFPESHVPREGGDPEAFRTDRWLALIWIPAFAGNAGEWGGARAKNEKALSLWERVG